MIDYSKQDDLLIWYPQYPWPRIVGQWQSLFAWMQPCSWHVSDVYQGPCQNAMYLFLHLSTTLMLVKRVKLRDQQLLTTFYGYAYLAPYYTNQAIPCNHKLNPRALKSSNILELPKTCESWFRHPLLSRNRIQFHLWSIFKDWLLSYQGWQEEQHSW